MSDKIKDEELDAVRMQFQDAVEKVNAMVAAAVTKWLQENESKIPESVVDMLYAAKSDIVAKMLGLSNRYGCWEVDHTNGGLGVAGRVIEKACGEQVPAWIKANFVPEKIKLSKEQKRAIEKEYKSVFNARLIEGAQLLALEHADQLLAQQVLPYRIKKVYGKRNIDLNL